MLLAPIVPPRSLPIDAPRRAARAPSLVALGAVAALVACGGDATRASQERASSAATGAATAAGIAPGTVTREGAAAGAAIVLGAADDSCPRTGAWRVCSVEDRLVRAGLAPQRADLPPARPAEADTSARYYLGGAEVQLFFFADSAARRRVQERLGPSIAAPVLLEGVAGAPAALVASANLLGVVIGGGGRQTERLELALGGGLPAS